jgi:hypothetical protein
MGVAVGPGDRDQLGIRIHGNPGADLGGVGADFGGVAGGADGVNFLKSQDRRGRDESGKDVLPVEIRRLVGAFGDGAHGRQLAIPDEQGGIGQHRPGRGVHDRVGEQE